MLCEASAIIGPGLLGNRKKGRVISGNYLWITLPGITFTKLPIFSIWRQLWKQSSPKLRDYHYLVITYELPYRVITTPELLGAISAMWGMWRTLRGLQLPLPWGTGRQGLRLWTEHSRPLIARKGSRSRHRQTSRIVTVKLRGVSGAVKCTDPSFSFFRV